MYMSEKMIDTYVNDFKSKLGEPVNESSISSITVRVPESIKAKYDEIQSMSGKKLSKVLSQFICDFVKKSEI